MAVRVQFDEECCIGLPGTGVLGLGGRAVERPPLSHCESRTSDGQPWMVEMNTDNKRLISLSVAAFPALRT
jgi:hypothetical protein